MAEQQSAARLLLLDGWMRRLIRNSKKLKTEANSFREAAEAYNASVAEPWSAAEPLSAAEPRLAAAAPQCDGIAKVWPLQAPNAQDKDAGQDGDCEESGEEGAR